MTDKRSHTAGPWHLKAIRDKLYVETTSPVMPVICDMMAEEPEPGEREEIEANARLIAAAPDLLEALRQIKATWDDFDGDREHATAFICYLASIWPDVEAAIAKAEGTAT